VPLGDGPEKRALVELGESEPAARAHRNVGRDRKHRDRGFVRLDDSRKNVRGAAARGSLANADVPGYPRVPVGHVGGRSFVAGQDVGDAVIETAERVIKGKRGVAAEPEDVPDAEALQHPDHRFGPGQRVHGGLSRHRGRGVSTEPAKGEETGYFLPFPAFPAWAVSRLTSLLKLLSSW